MTPAELEAELERGEIRPAYLLAGEEALLRDDALDALRRNVLQGGASDFNFDRLPGESTTPAALEDAVRALPVMAPRRLVVLGDPQARRAGAKALLERLAELVPTLLERSETVLVVSVARPDKRQRWVKAFARPPAAIVACDAPKRPRELAAFVRAEAARQGVALASGAAERLSELVGPQLLMLRQEIAKAALLAGPDEPVTRAHVEASTQQMAEEPIWDLTDAIGEGRSADALLLLSRLRGVAAPVVLGTLASHFRRLLRVRTGGAVAGPPFVRRKIEGQARRFSAPRLQACLRAIHETDVAIKGASALPPDLCIERLVLALVR